MKKSFLFFFFAFVLSAVFFFACSLFGDDDDGGDEDAKSVVELSFGTASFRGTVALDGVFPRARRASSARTVLPSLGEEISYSVVATGGGRTYTADVDGTRFAFDDLAVSEDGTEYTITASGTTTINEGGAEKTVRVLFGKVVLLLRGGDVVSGAIPVEPEMQDGKGRLRIGISVPDNVHSCEVKYQKILGGGMPRSRSPMSGRRFCGTRKSIRGTTRRFSVSTVRKARTTRIGFSSTNSARRSTSAATL